MSRVSGLSGVCDMAERAAKQGLWRALLVVCSTCTHVQNAPLKLGTTSGPQDAGKGRSRPHALCKCLLKPRCLGMQVPIRR